MVSAVVLVLSGLLGAVAVTAPASGLTEVSKRGDHHKDGHHAPGTGEKCIAHEETVVGPVCVWDTDVPILSEILNKD